MSQIALPLVPSDSGQNPEIVVGNANEAAALALTQPTEWPFHTAVLYGPPRSGKTLLTRWFAGRNPGARIIDDAERLPEDDIFHAWNRTQQDRQPLLIVTGDETWQVALPDLRSRLGAALHLAIGTPDDAMVAQLLEAHAAGRSLVLGEGGITYISMRIERSFAAIERIVAAIDRLSLERKMPPNRTIWRDALEAVQGPQQARLL